MQEVAKNLDAPIRLVFPKHFKGYDMIGLGDIFIPGTYICLAKKFSERNNCQNVYYWSFIGYCVGLLITITVLFFSRNPVPAFIFLCPTLIVFSFVAALSGGLLGKFVTFKRR
jgi:presenilin-like A22 family membrane protease